MSETSKTFTQALKNVVVPDLQDRGFVFDGSRTFRRFLPDGSVQIINFQLGLRSLAGKFTVNLGVWHANSAQSSSAFDVKKVREYDCPKGCHERLACLIPGSLSFLQPIPFLGVFFSPRDRWWPHSSAAAFTEKYLRDVMKAMGRYGFPWLEKSTKQVSS